MILGCRCGPESQEPAFAAVATGRQERILVCREPPRGPLQSPGLGCDLGEVPGPGAPPLAARHRTEPSDRAMSSSGSAATSAGTARRRTEAQPRRKAAVRRGQSGARSAVELYSAARMSCTRKPAPASSKSSSPVTSPVPGSGQHVARREVAVDDLRGQAAALGHQRPARRAALPSNPACPALIPAERSSPHRTSTGGLSWLGPSAGRCASPARRFRAARPPARRQVARRPGRSARTPPRRPCRGAHRAATGRRLRSRPGSRSPSALSGAATGSGTWKGRPPCRSRRRIRCSARTSATDRNPLTRSTYRCCPWRTRKVRLLVPCSPAVVMPVPGGKPHKGSSAAGELRARPVPAQPSWGDRRDRDIAPPRFPPLASDSRRHSAGRATGFPPIPGRAAG